MCSGLSPTDVASCGPCGPCAPRDYGPVAAMSRRVISAELRHKARAPCLRRERAHCGNQARHGRNCKLVKAHPSLANDECTCVGLDTPTRILGIRSIECEPRRHKAGLGDAALFLCLQRERRVVAQPRFRGPRFRGAGAPSSTLRRNDSSVSLVFGGPERRRSAATNFALQREFWLGSATHRLACANNLPAIP